MAKNLNTSHVKSSPTSSAPMIEREYDLNTSHVKSSRIVDKPHHCPHKDLNTSHVKSSHNGAIFKRNMI